jgi:hypothetical protein
LDWGRPADAIAPLQQAALLRLQAAMMDIVTNPARSSRPLLGYTRVLPRRIA